MKHARITSANASLGGKTTKDPPRKCGCEKEQGWRTWNFTNISSKPHCTGLRIPQGYFDSETKSLTFIFKFFHDVFHHLVVERFSSLCERDVQAVVDFLELLRRETEQNASIKCTQWELVAYVYQGAQQVPKGIFHLSAKPSDQDSRDNTPQTAQFFGCVGFKLLPAAWQ